MGPLTPLSEVNKLVKMQVILARNRQRANAWPPELAAPGAESSTALGVKRLLAARILQVVVLIALY